MPTRVWVEIVWKRDYIRFTHGDKDWKTRPEQWTANVDNEGTCYSFLSKDNGVTFFTATWPSQSESSSKKEKKEKDNEREKNEKNNEKKKKDKGKGKETKRK